MICLKEIQFSKRWAFVINLLCLNTILHSLHWSQAVSEQIAQERDAAEREAREKETRVLSLTRELDEMMDKVEEFERAKRQLQAELDELANNQGTADKNVSEDPVNLFKI